MGAAFRFTKRPVRRTILDSGKRASGCLLSGETPPGGAARTKDARDAAIISHQVMQDVDLLSNESTMDRKDDANDDC